MRARLAAFQLPYGFVSLRWNHHDKITNLSEETLQDPGDAYEAYCKSSPTEETGKSIHPISAVYKLPASAVKYREALAGLPVAALLSVDWD